MKTLSIFICLVFISLISIGNSKDEIVINPDLKLIRLKENIYLHENYTNSPDFGRFSSNGLLIFKNGKALMIDTPADNLQTKILYDYLKDSMKVEVTTFIGGHFHSDCIGGMEFLKSKKVRCILGEKTRNKCHELNLPMPDFSFGNQHDFTFEGIQVQCCYFGGGHTIDNIVVNFPNYELLFGGCLIKTLQSKSIGNIADAKTDEWVQTIEKVKTAFPKTNIVIPGHGKYGGFELLDHTINIVKEYLRTKQ